MTRQEYLHARHHNDKIFVLYGYYRDKMPLFYLDFYQYVQALDAYIDKNIENLFKTTGETMTKQQVIDMLFEVSVDYFDVKFEITYVLIEKVIKTVEKKTIIF